MYVINIALPNTGSAKEKLILTQSCNMDNPTPSSDACSANGLNIRNFGTYLPLLSNVNMSLRFSSVGKATPLPLCLVMSTQSSPFLHCKKPLSVTRIENVFNRLV